MKSLVTESAAAWRVSPRLAWAMIVLPFVGAAVVIASRVELSWFRFITKEDGPLEWPQCLLYLTASIFAAAVVVNRVRARQYWQAALWACFALAAFGIAGEEISWGQRVFGWSTPAEMAAINHQNETTVHNIPVVERTLGGLLGLVAGVALALPYVVRRFDLDRKIKDAYLIAPPVFLGGAFLMMFAYKLVRFTLLPSPSFTITKFGEWPEICFAFGLCAFAFLCWRRLRFEAQSHDSTVRGAAAGHSA